MLQPQPPTEKISHNCSSHTANKTTLWGEI